MLNNKFLVQSIVCGTALLAMNQTYADNPPNMELTNIKEAANHDKSINKSLNTNGLNLSLNIDEMNLNIDIPARKSKDKRAKKNKAKRPKTHYGIGYEYRKSLREKRKRTEGVAPTEKVQRPKRMQRSGRH